MKPSLYVFAVLVICGCSPSDKPEGFPKLYSATVTIKQADKELADATVRLVPLDASNTWATGAVTDQQGKAVMRTHGRYSGAPAGKYKVCVLKIVTEGAMTYSDIEKGENPNLKDSPGETYHVVATDYDDPEKTPFELEIASGKNAFEFSIPEAVKIVVPYGGVR